MNEGNRAPWTRALCLCWASCLLPVVGQEPVAVSAPPIEWLRSFERREALVLSTWTETPGGAWLLGWSRGQVDEPALLTKVSPSGQIEWEKALGPLRRVSLVELGNQGGIEVVGSQGSDVRRLWLNDRGEVQKARDLAVGMDPLAFRPPSGGMALLTATGQGFLFWRFRPDGSLAWKQELKAARPPSPETIVELPDGGFGLAYHDGPLRVGAIGLEGVTIFMPTFAGGGLETDILITRLGADGQVTWTKRLPNSKRGSIRSLIAHADGVIAVGLRASGPAPAPPAVKSDPWFLYLDQAGEIEWDKALPTPLVEDFLACAPTADGDLVAAFRAFEEEFVLIESVQPASLFAVKLSRQGEIRWEKKYPSARMNGVATPKSLAPAPDGGFWALSQPANGFDGPRWNRLHRMSEDGAIRWEKDIRGGVNTEAVLPARDGGLLVTTTWLEFPSAPTIFLTIGFNLGQQGPFTLTFGQPISLTARLARLAPEGTPESVLQPRLQLGSSARPTWLLPTRVGHDYTIETSLTLEPGAWAPLLTLRGDGETVAFPGLVDRRERRRFFRVRASAP